MLFTASDSPNSRAAIANVQRALARLNVQPKAVRIIDVFERPELAAEARVFVTPTLLHVSDAGMRMQGDLSDLEVLSAFLQRS